MLNQDIYNLRTVKEVIRLTQNLYRLGWDERNGGNVSVIFSKEEIALLETLKPIRSYPLKIDAKSLVGFYFLVTGTGKYFKNVEIEPDVCLGIFKISEDGRSAVLLWGLNDGFGPTSELPTHLLNHIERLKIDPYHRVVIHTHPTYTIAMTLSHPLDENEITKTLWRMQTESIVVFPEGVGCLPWMLCGGEDIGKATARKAKDYRLVIWAMHGVFGMGKTIDETFGLIETVEKAANIYMIARNNMMQSIKDDELKEIAKAFNLKYKGII